MSLGVAGGGDGGGAPTYINVAAALETPTTPTTTTTIGGPVTIEGTDLKATRTPGLTLENVTAAVIGEQVQNSPTILWQGSAWVSGAARTMQVRVTLEVEASGALVLLFQRDEGSGGGFTTAFRFDTSGSQFDARLYSFAIEMGGGSSIVFPNNGGMYQRGATGAVELKSRSEDGPLELYSETIGAAHPFRLYAAGEPRGASGTILIYGDDDGAGTFVERGRIMGDGVIEAPRYHLDAAVKTGNFSAAAWSASMVDLSGAAITVTIPAASAANIGTEIRLTQTAAGTADLVLSPASGNIEGAATLTIAGISAAPRLSVLLVSCGVGTGSPGWKVV